MGRAKPFRGSTVNAAHPLARGMFNCWLFNEGGGKCVFDCVERRRGDFYYGVEWKAGLRGHCVETDGSSGYVVLASDDGRHAASGGFSWSIRVMFWTLPSLTGSGIVFDCKAPVGHSWYLQSKAWDDAMGIQFYDSGSTMHALNGPVIEVGRWYDVGLVFDGDELFLYVDGRMVDTTEPGSVYQAAGSWLRLGHPGSYSAEAGCEHVMFWDRVLSPTEIRLLAREPYAMFERPVDPESLLHVLGLAGLIDGCLDVSGCAGLACRGQWQGGSLDIERKWLRGALFGGMDGDAMKLGTVLSGGWFWMRTLGCSGLYRGDTLGGIGFERVLEVGAAEVDAFSQPGYSPHNAGTVYHYCVRRFNESGIVEQTAAGARVAVAEDGQLDSGRAQAVGGLWGEQIGDGRVRLEWFYDSLDQTATPSQFEVYGDGGDGEIDFGSAIGEVEYAGRRFYRFECTGLAEGLHRLAVCARTGDGLTGFATTAVVSVSNSEIGGIEIVGADCV